MLNTKTSTLQILARVTFFFMVEGVTKYSEIMNNKNINSCMGSAEIKHQHLHAVISQLHL